MPIDGIVHVISICKNHNYPLIEDIRSVAPKFYRLSLEMLEEIEFFVSISCDAGSIICGLQKHFPNAIIHSKNVYNAIFIF
jgi:hypothetical protein